jgi:hypothetical protein
MQVLDPNSGKNERAKEHDQAHEKGQTMVTSTIIDKFVTNANCADSSQQSSAASEPEAKPLLGSVTSVDLLAISEHHGDFTNL